MAIIQSKARQWEASPRMFCKFQTNSSPCTAYLAPESRKLFHQDRNFKPLYKYTRLSHARQDTHTHSLSSNLFLRVTHNLLVVSLASLAYGYNTRRTQKRGSPPTSHHPPPHILLGSLRLTRASQRKAKTVPTPVSSDASSSSSSLYITMSRIAPATQKP